MQGFCGNIAHYLEAEIEAAEARETAFMWKEDERSYDMQRRWTLIMAPTYTKYRNKFKQARASRESGAPYRREFKEERSKLVNKHWGTRSAEHLAPAADTDSIADTEIDTEIDMDDA